MTGLVPGPHSWHRDGHLPDGLLARPFHHHPGLRHWPGHHPPRLPRPHDLRHGLPEVLKLFIKLMYFVNAPFILQIQLG